MSIYHTEVTRLNGKLMAYVEIQNDWNGSITCQLRQIKEKDGEYYVMVEGHPVYVTNDRKAFLEGDAKVKLAKEVYEKYRKDYRL